MLAYTRCIWLHIWFRMWIYYVICCKVVRYSVVNLVLPERDRYFYKSSLTSSENVQKRRWLRNKWSLFSLSLQEYVKYSSLWCMLDVIWPLKKAYIIVHMLSLNTSNLGVRYILFILIIKQRSNWENKSVTTQIICK